MPTFKDSLNRSWTIEITVLELKKIRNEFQIDLCEFASGDRQVIHRLSTDPVLLVDVLSCLLEDEIKQTGLTEKQFAQGIAGVGISNALEALVEALVNFSSPLDGAVLKALWNKMVATKEVAAAEVLEQVEGLDIQKAVKHHIDAALKPLHKTLGD